MDQDGRISVTDAILLLNHLFRWGWMPRRRQADADFNGGIELKGALVILRYLFQGATRPGG